jgi:hypothetical protein
MLNMVHITYAKHSVVHILPRVYHRVSRRSPPTVAGDFPLRAERARRVAEWFGDFVAMRNFFVVVFWIGVVLLGTSAVASRVAWLKHRRRGEPVRAAEAMLGLVLSLLFLAVLWLVYHWFIG